MEFKLEGEYIELIKLLKAMKLVGTGGEAKIRITEGEVLVNGQIDTRKRKKLRVGDVVDFDGETIEIV